MLSVWATLRLCKGKRGWQMQKQTLIQCVRVWSSGELEHESTWTRHTKKKIGGEEPTTNPTHLNNPNNTQSLMKVKNNYFNLQKYQLLAVWTGKNHVKPVFSSFAPYEGGDSSRLNHWLWGVWSLNLQKSQLSSPRPHHPTTQYPWMEWVHIQQNPDNLPPYDTTCISLMSLGSFLHPMPCLD